MEIKNAVNKAIDNIIKEGTTDVELFSRPFEIDLIAQDPNRERIANEVSTFIKAALDGDPDKAVENLYYESINMDEARKYNSVYNEDKFDRYFELDLNKIGLKNAIIDKTVFSSDVLELEASITI